MKMDKFITSKSDFRDVIKSNISKMFNIKDELHTTKPGCVYVDMNSVMSILFRHDAINDKDLIKDLTDIFEDFIDSCIRSSTRVKFVYTPKNSLVHSTIYPEWCSERSKRVTMRDSDFIIDFLTAMKSFSQRNKLIEIVNIEDKHISHYIKEDNHFSKKVVYVLSKDFVCQYLIFHIECIVFTGVRYIDFRDQSPLMFNNVDIKSILPIGNEWLYTVICGDVRNEYKGVPGYKDKRTIDYINTNRLKIVAGIEHPLSEYCNKHRALYDINLMIETYKKLKTN